MTLRRKMTLQLAVPLLGLLLLSVAALWGFNALRQDFSAAITGYGELRQIYDAAGHVSTARTLIQLSPHADVPAREQLQKAGEKFEACWSRSDLARTFASPIRDGLRDAQDELRRLSADKSRYDPKSHVIPLDRVLAEVEKLAGQLRASIERRQTDAERSRAAALLAMSGLALAVVIVSVLVGFNQYRAVMGPLRRLGAGVRRVSQGHLSERLEREGTREFVDLAGDFNRMAAELEGLYRDLERKVADKSRELVRSERLASVGYLAAGVAHEINNPIGIIAGYAEFSLETLRRQSRDPASIEEAVKTLGVIAEEAFRCKQIVEKLLSLARPGVEQRQLISLGTAARSVVSTIAGLGQYKGRQLTLDLRPGDDLRINAREGEMKQVILNLTLNALDATSETGGQVRIDVRRDNDAVELSVQDNGKGMTPQTLERAFEPFFTDKRGAAGPGTGLGLSITHAIVTEHGGRIEAHSDGPGKGSRLVVRIPAFTGESPRTP